MAEVRSKANASKTALGGEVHGKDRSPAPEPWQRREVPPLDSNLNHQGWTSTATREWLMGIASGTGVTGATGNELLDQENLRRMRFQDKAVCLLLFVVYLGSLAVSASVSYRQAHNSSPATYYADPLHYRLLVDTHTPEDFLEVFNQPPKDVRLQVSGFLPMLDLDAPAFGNSLEVHHHHHVAFSFALDLSPWLVREGELMPAVDPDGPAWAEGAVGVSAEDRTRLRDFLANDTNDLSFVVVQKKTMWPEWEELATNIKQKIRQRGFRGIINVDCSGNESMTVYKNRPWANFMHSRNLKVLCVLSIIGWIIYQPYMWLRCAPMVISSKYRVDVAIDNYWPLIADKVGPEGFNSGASLTS